MQSFRSAILMMYYKRALIKKTDASLSLRFAHYEFFAQTIWRMQHRRKPSDRCNYADRLDASIALTLKPLFWPIQTDWFWPKMDFTLNLKVGLEDWTLIEEDISTFNDQACLIWLIDMRAWSPMCSWPMEVSSTIRRPCTSHQMTDFSGFTSWLSRLLVSANRSVSHVMTSLIILQRVC